MKITKLQNPVSNLVFPKRILFPKKCQTWIYMTSIMWYGGLESMQEK